MNDIEIFVTSTPADLITNTTATAVTTTSALQIDTQVDAGSAITTMDAAIVKVEHSQLTWAQLPTVQTAQ